MILTRDLLWQTKKSNKVYSLLYNSETRRYVLLQRTQEGTPILGPLNEPEWTEVQVAEFLFKHRLDIPLGVSAVENAPGETELSLDKYWAVVADSNNALLRCADSYHEAVMRPFIHLFGMLKFLGESYA